MASACRLGKDYADPETGDLQTCLVDIEASQIFAERLTNGIEAVRTHRRVSVNLGLGSVIANHVDRAGVDDPADAVSSRCLEDIFGPDDVSAEDSLEAVLARHRAEMEDGRAARYGGVDRRRISQVCENDLLALQSGADIAKVCAADAARTARQMRTQKAA